MTTRHAFLTGLAAAHLVLVACGAFSTHLLPAGTPAYKWLRLYGEVSGADNTWGFFAPSVGWQRQTVFVFTDEEGRTWTEKHERGSTHETNLRLTRLTDTAMLSDGRIDRLQLRSWAASALGRHPTAKTVEIRLEIYQHPMTHEHRLGQKGQWKLYDHWTYTRASAETDDE